MLLMTLKTLLKLKWMIIYDKVQLAKYIFDRIYDA